MTYEQVQFKLFKPSTMMARLFHFTKKIVFKILIIFFSWYHDELQIQGSYVMGTEK